MDEIHTYSVSTEFLLKMMKDFLSAQLKKNVKERTKLILMSATLDYDMIKDYFKDITKNVPLVSVE
jgi:HrpA-like RNA helicase